MGKRDDYWRAYEIVKERLSKGGRKPTAKSIRDAIAGTAGGAEAVLASEIAGPTASFEGRASGPDYFWIESEIDNILSNPFDGELRDLLLRARRIAGYEALKANNDPAVA